MIWIGERLEMVVHPGKKRYNEDSWFMFLYFCSCKMKFDAAPTQCLFRVMQVVFDSSAVKCGHSNNSKV